MEPDQLQAFLNDIWEKLNSQRDQQMIHGLKALSIIIDQLRTHQETIAACLSHRAVGVRRRAVSLMAKLHLDDETLMSKLAECVDDEDERTSQLAINVIAEYGSRAIPILRRILERGTLSQRASVLQAIPSSGFDPRHFESALFTLLPKPEFTADVLQYVRSQTPALMVSWIPVIRDVMQTADGDHRLAAAFTLRRLDATADDAIEVLVEALGVEDHRQLAATFLNWIGSSSIQTLPSLIEALIDPDDGTCWEITAAIANIDDRNAVCNEMARTALHHTNSKIRQELTRILPRFISGAERSAEAESFLNQILKDNCLRVRIEAAIQLLRLNSPVSDLAGLIAESLESSDEQSRLSLLELARHLEAKDRVRLLAQLRKDTSQAISEAAEWEVSKPWAGLGENDLTPELLLGMNLLTVEEDFALLYECWFENRWTHIRSAGVSLNTGQITLRFGLSSQDEIHSAVRELETFLPFLTATEDECLTTLGPVQCLSIDHVAPQRGLYSLYVAGSQFLIARVGIGTASGEIEATFGTAEDCVAYIARHLPRRIAC